MTLDELITILLGELYRDDKPSEEQCRIINEKVSEVTGIEQV